MGRFSEKFPRATDPAEMVQPSERPTDSVPTSDAATIGASPTTDAQPALSVPGSFGRYHLLKRIGSGGMGSVYLAHDSQLDRPVAIKIPHLGSGDRAEVLARFQREARAAAALQHPHICPIHDVGEHNGVAYLTMGFIEGKPLAEFAVARPLLPHQSAQLVRKVALALHEAHKHSIIHRDLKSANIMIDKRGEPIVMDFGLARRARPGDARLTQDGQAMGTPAYMSPEQVAGNSAAIGPACDIYSLGVVLYELLAGRLPFTGDMMAMLSHVLLNEPSPPSTFRADLDPELEAICLKAMAKKIEDRHASMAEFATALVNWLRRQAGAPSAVKTRAKVPVKPPAPAAAPAKPSKPAGGIRMSQLGGLRSVAQIAAELRRKPDTTPAEPRTGETADSKRGGRRRKRPRRTMALWVWLSIGAVGIVGIVGVVLLAWALVDLEDAAHAPHGALPRTDAADRGAGPRKSSAAGPAAGPAAGTAVGPAPADAGATGNPTMPASNPSLPKDIKLARPEDGRDVPLVNPPPGAIVLFDGTNLNQWASRVGNGSEPARWRLVEGGAMQVEAGAGDIVTRKEFAGRFLLHVEFRLPYQPTRTGQDRGNSGVYLQGRYEVQILDSYGIPADRLSEGDCGGIYGVAKPPVNVCKAPTVWQSYDIDFQPITCKDGEPSGIAVISMAFNGTKIYDVLRMTKTNRAGNLEIVSSTPGGLAGDPCAPGPILLQEHKDPVQYRNIWLLPAAAKTAGAPPLSVPESPPAAPGAPAVATSPGFLSLFPRNLDGWQGLPSHWRFEGNTLIGGGPGLKAHTFLFSTRKYRDFELKFEVWLKGGDRAGNSGVQIRSWVTDEKRCIVKGPQCEIGTIGGITPWGSLVTEPQGSPRILALRSLVDKAVKHDAFNAYHIRCVGKYVTIKINGTTLVDGEFPSMPESGVIAWQLHGGFAGMEVCFKNIEIRELR